MPESTTEKVKQRLPLWVDTGMVLALVGLIWQMSAFVKTVDQVIQKMDELAVRVETLETYPIGPEASQRISVLETTSSAQDRLLRELKDDITRRLDRIENKIDRQAM